MNQESRIMNQESRIKKIKDKVKYLIHNSLFMIHESRGFTLVELLASVIVLVAVGSVVTGIISSSLRGANKTNTIENIRQNGNYALAQISKNIEYAQTFEGLSNDGVNYVTSCPFSAAPTPVFTTTTYNFIKIIPLNGSPTIYNCTGSILTVATLNGAITPTPNPLVDTNSISLTECVIACTQTRETDIPVIRIGFKLGPKNSNGLVENSNPPIIFETSVTMRNYKK